MAPFGAEFLVRFDSEQRYVAKQFVESLSQLERLFPEDGELYVVTGFSTQDQEHICFAIDFIGITSENLDQLASIGEGLTAIYGEEKIKTFMESENDKLTLWCYVGEKVEDPYDYMFCTLSLM